MAVILYLHFNLPIAVRDLNDHLLRFVSWQDLLYLHIYLLYTTFDEKVFLSDLYLVKDGRFLWVRYSSFFHE